MIAVPKGNPQGITGLADLAKPGVKVALCAEQVPCGAAAKKVLDAAGVKLTPVTLEQDVKAALTKVKLGEVDAALVYRTDVQGRRRPRSRASSSPSPAEAINDYPIVALKDAPNPAAARRSSTSCCPTQGQAGARPRPASRPDRDGAPTAADAAAAAAPAAAGGPRPGCSRPRCVGAGVPGAAAGRAAGPGALARRCPQRLAEPGGAGRRCGCRW